MYKTIDKLIEQARKDLARKRLAAARRQRERLLFTLERRATLTLKENRQERPVATHNWKKRRK
jgi:hypothetical protein